MIIDAFPKTNPALVMDMSVMALNHHIELMEEAVDLDPSLIALDLPFISLFSRRLADLERRMAAYQDLAKLTHEGKL